MGKRTALHDTHAAAGADRVDFAGRDMALHYGGQLDEHHAPRKPAQTVAFAPTLTARRALKP